MMEGNRLTAYNDRRSILRNSYHNRFKSSTAATTTGSGATQRHKRSENNNNSDRQSLNPSYIVSKSPTGAESVDKDRQRRNKAKKRYAFTVLMGSFILLLMLGENSNNHIDIDLSEEINNSLVGHNSDVQKDSLMATFTSNNDLKLPVEEEGYQTRRREIISPKQSLYGNTLRMNQNKESDNLKGKTKDTYTDSAASQLVDAIRRSEDEGNNLQLKITVNDENEDIQQRSSGLRISPGVPLPNQKLNMSRKRKKIFKPTNKLLSRIKTFPHQISNLNCALYNGPGGISIQ